MNIDKNIDFGGARNKRTSPSNSTRKTTYIDLCSCLYDRKWSKTLPVHVRKRSYVSVHNRMYASVFYALVLHIGVRLSREPEYAFDATKLTPRNETAHMARAKKRSFSRVFSIRTDFGNWIAAFVLFVSVYVFCFKKCIE